MASIESGIQTLWVGKKNFDRSFMQTSTAYQTLFVHTMDRKRDTEALLRQDVLTFRRNLKHHNVHSLSYQGMFSRMSMIYNLELLVSIAVLFLLTLFLQIVKSEGGPTF